MVIGVVTAIGFLALGLQTGPVAAAETLSCANEELSKTVIKKHNKKFKKIEVLGIVGDGVTVERFSIWQDEPGGGKVTGKKKKENQTSPDAKIIGDGNFKVRAERRNNGDGRVYHISIRATDAQNAICVAFLKVSVLKNKNADPDVAGLPLFDSTCKRDCPKAPTG